MSTLSFEQIRDELCNFIRSNDVLSITIRGVTTGTDSYTVAGIPEPTHTLANTPVKNVRSVTSTISGNLYYLRDYTIDFATSIITWVAARQVGDQLVISYDYGSSDKIYPDLPRDDLSLTSFPRIGIELLGSSTEPLGLGGTTHISDFEFSIIIWVPANRDPAIASGFGGLTDLNTTLYNIRNVIRNNAKSFYSFPWIYPHSTGPLIKSTNGKILQSSMDCTIKFKVE